MRKLFLLLFVFSHIANFTNAQIMLKSENQKADSLSYHENFDYFIKNIDKSEFSTNILYDRVIHWANLENFNPYNPKDTSDYKHFIQSYYEIYLSAFDNKKMKPFQKIKKEVKNKNTISIAILNYKYNYLDSNALKNNSLIIKNKQLYVNEKSEYNYAKQSEAFIAAILSNKLQVGSNTLEFTADYIFSNTKNEILAIELDFGKETGKYKIKKGETIDININKSGKLTVNYTLYLKNAKKQIAFSNINIEKADKTTKSSSNGGYVRVESGFYSDYENNSKKGIADMYFYYSNPSNPVLKRPIIIFDGFDPGDERNEEEIYNLMNKDHDLADYLRAKGFDVVIVNFPNGADYIVRNAWAAIEVIKYVNEYKTTDNKLIVVGPSMGGLITRYALAKMEKDGIDHETSLWVSFDAPHQGANIAIGDQYFLWFFGEKSNNSGALEGLAKINSPAAKQMLVDHYSKGDDNEKPQSDIFRDGFIYELTNNGLPGSNGYPQNLRKIALINGSKVANNQEGIDEHELLLEMEKKVLGIPVAGAEIKTSANNSFTRRWVCYAYIAGMPGNYTQQWSQPGDLPYFTTSYDEAPGGYYPTQRIIADGSSDFSINYPNHSFIPSVSALDIENTNLTEDIENADILGNNRTPFDNYYAPIHNEEHITFSSESVDWIKEEIGVNISITGSSTVCSSNSTFTLNNLPPEPTITWTKSSNLTQVGGNTGTSYAVIANGSGTGWVEAIVNGTSFRKDIQIGVSASITGDSYVNYFGSGSWDANSLCANKYNWYLKKEGQGGYVSVQNSSSNELTLNSVISKSKKLAPLPGEKTIFYLFVRAGNGNGSYYQTPSKRIVAKGNVDLVVGKEGVLPPFEIEISPNPANDVINIKLKNNTKNNCTNEEFTIRIIDKYQTLVYQKNIKNNNYTVNINGFQTGIYYLQVINAGKMFSKKFVIIN